MNNLQVLWLTDESKNLIHQDAFTLSNPNIIQHISSGKKDIGNSREGWRNADRLIRSWWKSDGYKTNADTIFCLEWDVYCNYPLEKLEISAGLNGTYILNPIDNEDWCWWQELNRLPKDLHQYATGCAPLGFLAISRNCLDDISDQKFDSIFAADIFSEMRLPTCVKSCEYNVQEFIKTDLKNSIFCHEINIPTKQAGIFHAVKKVIDNI